MNEKELDLKLKNYELKIKQAIEYIDYFLDDKELSELDDWLYIRLTIFKNALKSLLLEIDEKGNM